VREDERHDNANITLNTVNVRNESIIPSFGATSLNSRFEFAAIDSRAMELNGALGAESTVTDKPRSLMT